MSDIMLGLPPNVFRKTAAEISAKCPGVRVLPPRTHAEDHDHVQALFCARSLPPEAYPDLVISPDPEVTGSADWIEGSGYFEGFDDSFPPVRRFLSERLGPAPSRFLRPIAVIPLTIIYNADIGITPRSWTDLYDIALRGRIVIPPEDTPLPGLYRHFMGRLLGGKARRVLERTDYALYPLDINKAVDEGRYFAGVVFPAFARSSRLGKVRSCVPDEGPMALPVVAVKRMGAAAHADGVLRLLLSRDYQEYLGHSGDMIPVVEDAPLPKDIPGNTGFLWGGWELFRDFAP
jgi:hypothetical protein